ncbi:hypothetical protein CEUSTIGMA_g4288.t1 [Chlamydomonas eustigma]|uniref:Dynamin N-terminal domain-containing protein n=1 Tax=Chlamydomonas eustigma TaxID=1157962 RepID=A0A250X1S7_9CHLO|nr:hypothetical protein CEUSTIGMA_g4288.t1 [Chlamydomonas eustigma]|eukprot:GAX76842.1 hypothetical protein CEUSTIGMA_g4288.t1 [Chlamydomonas eustigma]
MFIVVRTDIACSSNLEEYSNDHGEEGQFVQQSDGQFVRYLPAPLLKEMNIVDTPGTNVILDRQQRLTEEYVPRADLVLFVMSADRPFSESEVKFLEYIRQWRKKVVFVVNKVDMLGSVDEVAEVKRFVFENAQRLLKLDSPNVLTVSSRAAMRAKADVLKERGLPVNSWEDTLLLERPEWIRSGYSSLEAFIFNFLAAGESDKAGEGVRLKLQTPLFVADALLGASARSLKDELDAAKSEMRAVSLVEKQLVKFQADMERDAAAQREALNKVLMDATSRLEAFVDRTIQLSNASAMNAYLSGSKTALDSVVSSFEAELSAGPLSTLQGAVSEHQRWLELNCSSQLEYYKRFVAGRGGGVQGSSSTSQRSSVPVPSIASSSSSSSRGGASGAVATAKEFSSSVVVTMLSEEMREAVVGTAGLTVGGPVGGLLVSTLTGGTFEDLLILTIGGLVAYVSVINIPLRRAAIKAKGRTIAANFVKDLQAKMKQEQEEKVILVMSAVSNMVAPIQASCSKEVDRLEQQELRRQNLLMELTELQKKAANVE